MVKRCMMSKKAQGLSVNVIIVAAIALIVLVVLVAIFTGRLGGFSKGVRETTSCTQICVARGYDSGSTDEAKGTALLGARDGDGKQCYCKEETTPD
ncbi:MAG: hypothetical protein V1831_00625 [Candidatus Woesearchaeota archaeon]